MKLNVGLLGVIIFLLIDLLIAVGFIGYQVWRHYEQTTVYSKSSRNLQLLCGSYDKERGQFRGERVLCNPRIGSEGREI